MSRRPWTVVEVEMLRRNFPDSRTDDLAQALGRNYGPVAQKAASLGLVKSDAYLQSPAAHRLDGVKGIGTRIQPGAVPWNKGLRGVVGVQEACRATQFKKGRPAEEARNYLPVGTIRINADGCLERKLTDDPSLAPARRWEPVHRLVWIEAHGPVPAGHVVVFLPGRRATELERITLDAVELVTRRELMNRNTVHAKYPPELARLVQLRGALQRQINRKTKEAETA